MRYILDSPAILTLGEILLPGAPRDRAFGELSAHVKNGNVVFPDDVLNECREFGAGETAAVWATGVASSRMMCTYPGNTPRLVLQRCADLIDPESERQSHAAVACLAWHLVGQGIEVTVVSEDLGFGGGRRSLPDACAVLGFPAVDLGKMLQELGLSDCLA